MEIIKLLINIIKKILKYFFILLIIGGIIGGGVYLWQENENKKERELNLAFFTGVKTTYSGDKKGNLRLIDWQVDDYRHNPKGQRQFGFDGYGKLYYRHVKRNENPPQVNFYYLEEEEDDDKFNSHTVWLIDCPASSTTKYSLDEDSATIKCGENGKFLYTSLWHSARDIDYYFSEINANGFSTYISTKDFDINRLRQNMTLMKLKSDDS